MTWSGLVAGSAVVPQTQQILGGFLAHTVVVEPPQAAEDILRYLPRRSRRRFVRGFGQRYNFGMADRFRPHLA